MTLSYIIWRLSIWIKYMVICILTVYYQALCEYWQSQDSTQTEGSRNIIGHIYYNQIYYWSINGKSRWSKMCYVTLVSVLIEKSRGPKHNNRLVLSKALHPSSFHCCQPQPRPLSRVLSCLAFLLCVRACALCLWCLSALESSWKRELQIKG